MHDTLAGIRVMLGATRTGTMITTAYIERLNATFRSRLSCLTRYEQPPHSGRLLVL